MRVDQVLKRVGSRSGWTQLPVPPLSSKGVNSIPILKIANAQTKYSDGCTQ